MPRSRMTKKQTSQIESAIYHIGRSMKFIQSPRTVVAMRDTMATTTLHYVRPSDGAVLYEVDKEIGSDLTGLEFAKRELERLLNPEVLDAA